MVLEDEGIDLVCAWIEGFDILFPQVDMSTRLGRTNVSVQVQKQGSSLMLAHPTLISRSPSSKAISLNSSNEDGACITNSLLLLLILTT